MVRPVNVHSCKPIAVAVIRPLDPGDIARRGMKHILIGIVFALAFPWVIVGLAWVIGHTVIPYMRFVVRTVGLE